MNQELKKALTNITGTAIKSTYDVYEDNLKKRLSDKQFRKVRKLANNPELFVKDVVDKRTEQARKYIPIKHKGNFQYTVVSAVYNVGKYLDEYFDSLVNQSLNFKKHIHLILVDDGSTDNSAQIIKKWQKKYPKNIHYYYKENGGISSARNYGLQFVKTEWVTFIDSDDFVNNVYFKIIDDVLYADKDIEMVVGNLYYYHEKNKQAQDKHSLNYRFTKAVNKVCIDDMKNYINLFVTVTFFKTEYLRNANLIFDERIKPHFEDGKFIADYLLYVEQGKVAYVKDAIFYYRKREDATSTIDTAWLKKEKFYDLLAYGYLPLLKSHQDKFGYVPKNIQWTVIYDLFWHMHGLRNNPDRVDLAQLTQEEQDEYLALTKECFSYLDVQHIMDFNLIGVWHLHKVAALGTYKGLQPEQQIAYIENVDFAKKQILICYFSCFEDLVSFQINGVDTLPIHAKRTKHSLGHFPLVSEYRYWVPFNNESDFLRMSVNEKNVHFSLFNAKHYNGLPVKHILERYSHSDKYTNDGSWIFMDRDTQADDNAEHLYRYVVTHYPEKKCYFALNKTSKHWDRLQQEGFNLLDFGSDKFKHQLRKADKIISSHFDGYIQNHFGDEYQHSKKFVFLQHGVIKDNMARWLNYKRNMLCMVTTTPAEYHSIADNDTFYHLGKKETVLTGLPRHDNLLKGNGDDKLILIMPTWRMNIVGEPIEGTNERALRPDFMQTDFAIHWQSLLQSKVLQSLAEQYGYEIIFAPHANIEPYLDRFKLPAHIKTWSALTSDVSIQSLFQRATLMITDYSSVAFDMAVLNKTTLYYQFDKDEFFTKLHIMGKGYFDYTEHGFGAVAETENELLTALEQVLQNEGKPIEPYATRIHDTFPFRDGGNCERVYQAIVNLDAPDEEINVEVLQSFIHQAKLHEHWQLLEQRLDKWFGWAQDNKSEVSTYHDDYLLALLNQHKLTNMLVYLANNQLDNTADWLTHINDVINNEVKPDLKEVINRSELVEDEVLHGVVQLLKAHQKANLLYIEMYVVRYLVAQKSWQLLDEIFADHATLQSAMKGAYALSQVRLNQFHKLDKKLPRPAYGDEYDYWQIMADVAVLNDNVELRQYCYKGMIAIFGDREKTHQLSMMK